MKTLLFRTIANCLLRGDKPKSVVSRPCGDNDLAYYLFVCLCVCGCVLRWLTTTQMCRK